MTVNNVMQLSRARVFNDATQRSLCRANNALRTLRGWGLRVVRSEISPRPHLRIVAPPNSSLAPLLDAAGRRQFREQPGATVVACELDGVLVSWEKAE